MKELQIYLESDIKANDPSISKHDLNEKVNRLIIGVENEIREELRQQFPEMQEKDIDERVRNIKVKGKGGNRGAVVPIFCDLTPLFTSICR